MMKPFKELPGIRRFFSARAETKATRDRSDQDIKNKEETYFSQRINLYNRIDEELDPTKCPVDEIVPRLISIIKDASFSEYKAPTKTFADNYPEADKYKSEPMLQLFMKRAVENAHRVFPDDAVGYVRVLFASRSFNKLDDQWFRTGPLNDFLTHGLDPLARKAQDKVKFFRACETESRLKIMVETCNPENVANFLCTLFEDMDVGVVESVLSQSCVMEFVDPEVFNDAFDKLGTGTDPRLVNVFKKYIGYSPNPNMHIPSFEAHYPPGSINDPHIFTM